MFKFLKDKLKDAVSKFSKDVDDKTEEIKAPDVIIKEPEVEKKIENKPEAQEQADISKPPKLEEKKEEPKEEKKGFFSKLFSKKEEKKAISEEEEELKKEVEEIEKEVEEITEEIKSSPEIKEEVKVPVEIKREDAPEKKEKPLKEIKKEEPKDETKSEEQVEGIFGSAKDKKKDDSWKKIPSVPPVTYSQKEKKKADEEKPVEKKVNVAEIESIFVKSKKDVSQKKEEVKPLEVKPKSETKKEEPKPEVKPEPKPSLKVQAKKEELKPEVKPEPKQLEKKQPEEDKKQVVPKEELDETLDALKEDEEKLEHMFEEEKPEKKGFFGKIKEAITKKSLSEREFDDLFFELEIVLLENNVAVEVIEKIKKDLKKELVETKVLRGKVKDIIEDTLRASLIEILNIESIDIFEKIKRKKPFVITFVGINGTGKTTSVAKFASMIKSKGLTCVVAAADTFRAAAIQQLEEHATNLDIKMIKHDYGSDPAAVAFDAVKYAEAKNIDVVLIDTAGRQHSNSNLMDELKKVIRVAKPDLKIFVGDSLTGNDCVEQSTQFNEAVGIDAIILTKVDVDEKGGAALSVSYVTGKPIIYVGTGQGYGNLEEFDYTKIMANLGFDE